MGEVIIDLLMQKLVIMISKDFGESSGVLLDLERLYSVLSHIRDDDAMVKEFTQLTFPEWIRKLKTLAYENIDVLDELSLPFQKPKDSGRHQQVSASSLFPFLNSKRDAFYLITPPSIEMFISQFEMLQEMRLKFYLEHKETTLFNPSEPRYIRYFGLPVAPYLRHCFAYCSIFPKGYEMRKHELICLWMANGFIPSTFGRREKVAEDIADDMFNELLRGSFFEVATRDAYGNVVACKISDRVYDLASFEMEGECSIIEVGNIGGVVKGVRHLSLIYESSPTLTSLGPVFERLQCLHTLIFLQKLELQHACTFDVTSRLPCLRVLNMKGLLMENLPDSVCDLSHLRYLDVSKNRLTSLPESIHKLRTLQALDVSENEGITTLPFSIGGLKCLRHFNLSQCSVSSLPESILNLTNLQTLDWSRNYSVMTLPPSIGDLKSLRYFNLSECKLVKSLPESVCCLSNLQTLILRGCSSLVALPETTRDMRSLRHLDIQGCSALTKMPIGIGTLTHLKTLNLFVLGSPDRDGGFGGMEELQRLDQLHGELDIQGLENSTAVDAKEANLGSKNSLTKLKLSWGCVSSPLESNSNDVLEGLQLPPNIKELIIHEYPLEKCFSQGSLGILSTLQCLQISSCKELVGLPEGLQNLHSLEELRIECCPRIECLPVLGIENASLSSLTIESCDSLMSVTEGIMYLTSLKMLSLQHCLQLELGSGDLHNLVSLRDLRMEWLPKLTALPEGIQHLTMLRHLKIGYCWNLQYLSKGLQCLTSLQTLQIHYCPNLQLAEGDFEQLIALQSLQLGFLPRMDVLPKTIQCLTMLRNLEILRCENLRMLPEDIKYLTALQFVKIKNCHQDLHIRCEKGKGKDWHLISHISHLDIEKPPKESSSKLAGDDRHLMSHISHLDIEKPPKESSSKLAGDDRHLMSHISHFGIVKIIRKFLNIGC